MSSLTKDDLRAAVAAGTLSEAQAASVLALADARRGVRENMDGLDEPFELFKGFNEIFIVVGLTILCTGYVGFAGLLFDWFSGGLNALLTMGLGAAAVLYLARYFVLKRRMVAPAIALSIMFAGFALMFSASLVEALTTGRDLILPVAAGLGAVATLAFWRVFHVPFALFLVAWLAYVAAFGATTLSGLEMSEFQDAFVLTADGPFSLITLVMGLVALGFALRFDLSDPHRVTRRAANAFWLHVIAAPAIVNTVALTLFSQGGGAALLVLFAFLALMALLAVVIDRRSFLISGVGYAVALAVTVADGGTYLIILLLGLGLVFLGAQWERLRNALMRALPTFPGKDRLPPWDIEKVNT